MKAMSKISIAILSFVLLQTSGCDKFKGDAGPAGPSLTGDLIGYAYLYDVDGNHVSDNSGIVISVDGTNTSTTSAANGQWILSGLGTGTYTITFSKAAYGIEKMIGLPFVGGGQAYYGKMSLFQIPSFTITELSATTSTRSIDVSGTLSGSLPTIHRYARLFISTSPTVSSDPKDYVFTYTTSVTSTTVSASMDKSTFNAFGINSGLTAYIVAYGEGFGAGSYVDLSTGRSYYPCINPTPSNVVSAIVP